jgi:hypothetical protein
MYLCAVDFSDDCHDHAIVAVIEAMLPSWGQEKLWFFDCVDVLCAERSVVLRCQCITGNPIKVLWVSMWRSGVDTNEVVC